MAAPQIRADLSCSRCEYNLRGLPTDGRCPECGASVEVALFSQRLRPQGMSPLVIPPAIWARLFATVSATGYPIDAVLFVRTALKIAFRKAKQQLSHEERPRASAADICTAFQNHVHRFSHHQASIIALLNEWGIRSSEDVGRIVLAMATAGLLKADEDDMEEHFRGLFTLETLPSPS